MNVYFQGQTLEEVIIDFGPDKKLKIKNFIIAGSFYVALTRVKSGNKVFLKRVDEESPFKKVSEKK